MPPEQDPRAERGVGMSEKVVRLHEALARAGVPHALGGAIAVDYYRIPRATIDIDLNVFVPPEEGGQIVEVLGEEFVVSNPEALKSEIAERGQGMTYWGETRIDLFFIASEFNEAMAARVREVPYLDATIPILSAEDIVVMKAVFDRTQDWADIEAVCKLRGDELDADYMKHWLVEILGEEDPRVTRLLRLVEASP